MANVCCFLFSFLTQQKSLLFLLLPTRLDALLIPQMHDPYKLFVKMTDQAFQWLLPTNWYHWRGEMTNRNNILSFKLGCFICTCSPKCGIVKTVQLLRKTRQVWLILSSANTSGYISEFRTGLRLSLCHSRKQQHKNKTHRLLSHVKKKPDLGPVRTVQRAASSLITFIRIKVIFWWCPLRKTGFF